MGATPGSSRKRPGSVRRVLGWLLDQLPGPPGDHEAGDPLLAGIDALPPTEREARRRVFLGRFRRGRGDSADG